MSSASVLFRCGPSTVKIKVRTTKHFKMPDMRNMRSEKELPRDVEEQNKMADATEPVIGYLGSELEKIVITAISYI